MGSSGLEPPTSRLSGVRSNLLSYEPISYKRFSTYEGPLLLSGLPRFARLRVPQFATVAFLACARNAPLLTGPPPRFSRHWRRSAPDPENYIEDYLPDSFF